VEKTLLMAVDLGTSFIKAGIYDLHGNCIAQELRNTICRQPEPGIFLQKGEELFSTVLTCMTAVINKTPKAAEDLEAISFTGQMAGFMGVDKDWNDMTGWSCSLDTRYIPYAKKQQEKFGDDFLLHGGTNAPLMAPKLEWFRTEFPCESGKIAKYMMLNGYCLGKLGGLKIDDAIIDYSLITWSGLADIRAGSWSEEICSGLKVDPGMLPRIVESAQICAYLQPEMAAVLGLPAGIPLVAGAGDKIAGCVGAAVCREGDMIFEASSYGGFSSVVGEYRPDTVCRNYDGLIGADGKTSIAHKYIPGSGITLKWFLDNFGKTAGMSDFQELDARAALVHPGCDGLAAVGLLGGSAMPFDGGLKGMWIGYDWTHRPEHFYRALLESFSFDLALTIDSIETNYPECPKRECKLTGGGASSRLWAQMLADVTGRPFQKLNRKDSALWGTAILAGKGLGIFENMGKTAGENIEAGELFLPDREKTEVYHYLKERYRRLRDSMHGILDI
jgi:xylulokinase